MNDFVDQFYEWDSKYSIFTSELTLRQLIRILKLLRSYKDSNQAVFTKKKINTELVPQMLELELTIKTELGVFSREGFHNPKALDLIRKEHQKS